MQTTFNCKRSPTPSGVTLGWTSKASCCLWAPDCSLALALAVSMWIFFQVWKWNLQFRVSSRGVWAPLSCKVLTESWLKKQWCYKHGSGRWITSTFTKKTWNVRWFLEDSATKVQYVKFKLWGQWDCKEILQVSNPRVSLMSLGSLFLWGKGGTVLYAIYFHKRKAAETLKLFSSVSTAPLHFWNFHSSLVLAAGTFTMLKCLYIFVHAIRMIVNKILSFTVILCMYILQTNTFEFWKLTWSVVCFFKIGPTCTIAKTGSNQNRTKTLTKWVLFGDTTGRR